MYILLTHYNNNSRIFDPCYSPFAICLESMENDINNFYSIDSNNLPPFENNDIIIERESGEVKGVCQVAG